MTFDEGEDRFWEHGGVREAVVHQGCVAQQSDLSFQRERVPPQNQRAQEPQRNRPISDCHLYRALQCHVPSRVRFF